MHSTNNAIPARAVGRSLLLASAAGLSMAIASVAPAQAQQVVNAREGETIEGNVVFGAGDDRLIVDASRVDAETGRLNTGANGANPPIIDGTLTTGGGNDSIWLNSTASRTVNVVVPGTVENREDGNDAVFNRIVYEAQGADTVVRLENRANPRATNDEKDFRDGPLRLAGDGTIEVTFGVQASNQPFETQAGIVVEAGNSAGSDGRLNVIVRDDVTGNDIGRQPGGGRRVDSALIDARNARRLEIADAARVRVQDGTAILAGDADVVVQRNALVAVIGTNATGIDGSSGIGIRSSGRIVNEGRIDARNQASEKPASATAIVLQGGIVENRRGTSSSGIFGGRNAIFATGDSVILNDGQIESVNDVTIASFGNTVTRNGADGVIVGGNVDGRQVAYEAGVDGTDVIVNAGQIRGDISLGGDNDIFLVRGNGTVTGSIDGGAGLYDAYGHSFSETGTLTLANNSLNIDGRTGFEMHGIEAEGADTVVTVNAAETLTDGLQVIGDGTVVNTAAISTAGAAYGIYIRDIPNVAGNGTFINRGQVNSVNRALFSESSGGEIRNEGTLASQLGVLVQAGEDADGDALDIVNSGVISATSRTASALTVLIEKVDHVSRISNEAGGTITQTTTNSANDLAFALNARSRGRVELNNAGNIVAQGRTDGGARIEAASIDVANSGTIEGRGDGGSGLTVIATGNAPSGEPEVVASVRNAGTIRANGGGTTIDNGVFFAYGFGAGIGTDNGIVELENSGTIEATGADSVAVLINANNPDGPARAQFRMTNTGTIRGSGTDTILEEGDIVRNTGIGVAGDTDSERVVASAIQTYGTTDDIVNEGTIIGNVDLADGDDRFENRGRVEGDVRLGDGDDTYVFALGSTLTGTAFGGDGFDRLLIDGSGNENGRLDAAKYREFELIEGLAGVTQGTGILSVVGAFDVDTVGIANISIQIDAGDTVSSEGGVTFTGSDGSERITNFGTIAGSVDMGAGDDVVINAGAIQGDVLLGAGNDRYVARAGSSVTGVIDGGDGIDTFEFLLDGDIGQFPSDVVNFESYAARGQGTINVTLDQDIDTIELLEGANLILNDGTGTIRNIVGDDSDNIVTITGTLTGGVSLGGGDDVLNLTLAGILSGALDGGAGDDTLNLTLTGASTINGLTGFETTNVFGDSPLTLAGTLGAGQTLNFDGSDNELIIAAGATFDGIVNGGDGRDLLRIQSGAADSRTVIASQIVSFEDLIAEGAGTLALTGGAYSFETVSVEGALELGTNTSLASAGGVVFGAGDNRLRLASGATITGGVDGGDGDDLLQLEQAQGSVRSLRSLGATGFERLESSGVGELQIDIDSVFDSVAIDGGRVTVAAGTTLTAPVFGEAGNDTLAVLGTLVGDVDLGAGDDRLILASHGAGNSYSGGAGTDTLELRIASTYENPFELAAGTFVDFERLEVGSGVVSVTADTSWDGIAITGGRLIGQAGTTITSGSPILVSAGATFGSAGTVNADIDVRGTLSPGASPGTMTVNGDVIFRTGSNLFLEVSPTLSDLLDISGRMTIENGAAIDITGVLQAAPGELLDLVVAQGGIEGRFTTINKSDTVFGFVVQNGNRIQIRSEFENDAALPSNVRASVDYSNQVLRAGYGVQAYTAALPLLTDAQGRVNAAAFAQLTPEAYGSAMQLGVEAGLTLADGTRQISAQQPVRDGLFLFAQTGLSRTDLNGNARTGASAADIDSNAFFGGLGYGFGGNMQIGTFIGTIDGTQVLAPLGAITDNNMLALGAFADARFGGFGVHAMIAWLNGDATTTRTIAAAPSAAVGDYDLDGWVADLSVDYRFDLGRVSIAPRVGLTYVETRRDAVAETGAGAFALTVSGDRQSTLFGDAAVRLGTTLSAGGLTLHPYVEAGVRTILDGQQTLVAGRFTGAPGAPILVDGVERDRVTARLATGLGIDLASSIRLNVGYAAELGQVDRGTLSGGIAIRF